MADKDDDRDELDEEEVVEKKPEKKPAKVAAKSKGPATLDDLLLELQQIKSLLHESKEQRYPHLWLLFPIAAAVLIQAIFTAMRL